MFKKILIAAFFVPSLAFADANDLRIEQRNSTDTATIVRTMPNTAPDDSILYYNGSTLLPGMATLGSGLAITSGVLTVTVPSQVNSDWNASSGVAKILNKPSISTVGMTGLYADILGTPSLSAVATSGAYGDLSGKPTLGTASTLNVPSSGDAATGEVVKGSDTRLSDARTPTSHTHPANQISDSTSVGRSVVTATDAAAARTAIGAGTGNGSVTSITAGTGLSGGTITGSGTISMPNTGTAGTYSGVTTDAQGRVTSGTTRSFSYSTRSLNTCFQVSSSRDAFVTYAVDIATVSTLASGQVGTVYLRIYTNSSCTTGTQEISRFVNGNTQTLGLSVTMSQNVTATLTAMIPAGAYVQLVTENTTGTPTFTARPGQEVLL